MERVGQPGPPLVDILIAKLQECDTVMTEPEIAEVARAFEDPIRMRMTGQDTVLKEAEDLIRGERMDTYGDPKENLQNTAISWSQILGVPVSPLQVCMMMIQLKIQRLVKGEYHRDSLVDIGGYAALAAILQGDDQL